MGWVRPERTFQDSTRRQSGQGTLLAGGSGGTADARALGARAERRGGSNPPFRTSAARGGRAPGRPLESAHPRLPAPGCPETMRQRGVMAEAKLDVRPEDEPSGATLQKDDQFRR